MKNIVLLLFFVSSLCAFSQSGETDSSFGVQGKVVTSISNSNGKANAIAFQPDGKFIVGGSYISSHGDHDFALARYNSDWSLDITFGINGKVVTDFLQGGLNFNYIHSIYVLASGKIVVYGSAGIEGFPPKSAIVRYNADGTLDTGFGNGGKVLIDLFAYNLAGNKLAFMPDGKFIITSVKIYNADPNYYLAVARYTEDGILDTTFGSGGQAVTSFGTGKSIPSSVLIQPDGKIVIAGHYEQAPSRMMSVVRYNANGTLDTGFDGDGKVTTSFGAGTYSEGMNVFLNQQGKIIIAGIVYTAASINFGVLQYNTNGTPDTSFDSDGKATSDLSNYPGYNTINSVIRQPDGKFLLTSRITDYASTTSDFVIRRYNANILPDSAFGINGVVATTFDTGLNEAQSVAVTTGGELFAVGRSSPAGNSSVYFAIAKYDSSGNLDTTLNGSGKLTTAFEKGNDRIKKLLILPNDKFIAVGTSAYRQSNNTRIADIAMTKYNSDGSPDTTFGNLGTVRYNPDNQRYTVVTAALQADGKIIVTNTYGSTTYLFELVRYNTDGSLDMLFGTNGKISLNFSATAILCQPDGKIIVTGCSDNGIRIIRFTNNGMPDTSFGTDGSTTINLGDYCWGMASAVLQPDGKIIISDTALSSELHGGSPFYGTARINSDGSIDTTFGNNGRASTLIGDVSIAYATFLQPDGKIVVAGKSIAGSSNFSAVRYTATGEVDISYGTGGVTSSALWNDYKEINDIHLQADGKFLVVLSKYNEAPGIYNFKIRRFNPDSSIDFDFGGNYGVETSFYNGYDEAFSIALQSDNKIIIGGSTHNGVTEDFALTRYTNAILAVEGLTAGVVYIKVYPNPVKDILYFEAGNGYNIGQCTIYNIVGQLVYKGEGKEINTRTLSSGIYNLAIHTDKGIIITKFIKE